MSGQRVTRGYGLLERFLARQRARTANKLIPSSYRKHRILDIGCGSYPLFLVNCDFAGKYGIDQIIQPQDVEIFGKQGLAVSNYNVAENNSLPFEDEYFAVVTMLAVLEHIEYDKLIGLLNEIYRILIPGGMLIITTPSPWSDKIIKIMAKLFLISPEEAQEHQPPLKRLQICSLFQKTKFSAGKLQSGYFEMFLNMWFSVTK